MQHPRREFRDDVVRVARLRALGMTLEQITPDGIPVTVTCRVLNIARPALPTVVYEPGH
jgi:hypothetical protein